MEEALSKGSGQYKTTIGFIDVTLHWGSALVPCGIDRCCNPAHGPCLFSKSLRVEVKIGRVGADAVLRQIALYREYEERAIPWFVASPWAFSAADQAALASHGIGCILLGSKFSTWKAAQINAPGVPDLEV